MFTSRRRHTLSSDEDSQLGCDRRVDGPFRHYLDWRRQSSTCESAYREWVTAANSRESALAFATYTAALDREEQAAARYRTAVAAERADGSRP